ncbi:Domain of uncharacterised function (DUF2825) [Plesiomonas shigelloides]|nr:Domain of uncharacterised function (DUF2825) [Plesiomonas shigelloides]
MEFTIITANTVHPRWRGEHQFIRRRSIASSGSSPLARGAQHVSKLNDQYTRFIPAGAGSTRNSRTPTGSLTVHPRWRGEHSRHLPFPLMPHGSSPLARGARFHYSSINLILRFIPAGAGSTIVPRLADP